MAARKMGIHFLFRLWIHLVFKRYSVCLRLSAFSYSFLARASDNARNVSFESLSGQKKSSLDTLVESAKSEEPASSQYVSSISSGIYDTLVDFVHGSGGSLPPPPTSANNDEGCVLVYVDGMDFQYQLTEADLLKVFDRYGVVNSVTVSAEGTSAVVTLSSTFQANSAISSLNGRTLNGLVGCLRVVPWPARGETSPVAAPQIRKYTCRFDIQIDNDKDFHVARRIIGQKGSNMKRIVKQAGYDAKLRLRGRGSGFLEGAQKQESQEPLHLCVSCKDYNGYRAAIVQVEELLGEIYADFQQYSGTHFRIVMHEHPLLYQPTAPAAPSAPVVAPAEDPPENIESLIEQRNEARRVCNFKEADRIRDLLRDRGVGLMDEPGGRGRGTDVTTWRFWRS